MPFSCGRAPHSHPRQRFHSRASGPCKVFLESPGSVLLSEGSYSGPRAPEGDQLPLVMVPSSAGAGTCANDRCLVWHPEDEVLVPMAEQKGGERRSTAVSMCDHIREERGGSYTCDLGRSFCLGLTWWQARAAKMCAVIPKYVFMSGNCLHRYFRETYIQCSYRFQTFLCLFSVVILSFVSLNGSYRCRWPHESFGVLYSEVQGIMRRVARKKCEYMGSDYRIVFPPCLPFE